jgi:hypothetical protein
MPKPGHLWQLFQTQDTRRGIHILRRARLDRLHVLKLRGERVVQKVAAVHDASYLPRRTQEFLRFCIKHARKA